MINLVTTRSHRYTHAFVDRTLPMFRRVTYGQLFRWREIPPGTYIFSDFDRLNFWQLELATRAFRALEGAGCRVLNDPGKALQRLPLLQRLYRLGLNSFNAWPATDLDLVNRFPVFLRTAPAHRGNLTDLLYDKDTLMRAYFDLLDQGYPQANLIIVEFRGEPVRDNVYRKLAMYRIGDQYVSVPSVHESNWTAKYGENGIAGEEGYADDLESVITTRYVDDIRRVFEASHIEYGRADFSIVNGRVEAYEINTNPYVHDVRTHSYPARVDAFNHTRSSYRRAMTALDSSPHIAEAIKISLPPVLSKQRRIIRLLRGQYWVS